MPRCACIYDAAAPVLYVLQLLVYILCAFPCCLRYTVVDVYDVISDDYIAVLTCKRPARTNADKLRRTSLSRL